MTRIGDEHILTLIECLAAFFEGRKGSYAHRCYHRCAQGCSFCDSGPFDGQSRDVGRGLQPEIALGASSNRAYGFHRETTPPEEFDILSKACSRVLPRSLGTYRPGCDGATGSGTLLGHPDRGQERSCRQSAETSRLPGSRWARDLPFRRAREG